MADIIQFPVPSKKFGFARVKRRTKPADSPDQLQLFSQPVSQVISFALESNTFEQALMLDESGDPKAADLYQKAIDENHCVADAYCNLGIIESQKGETSKAFDYFTTALKHEPRHSEAHYNLGNLYFEVDNLRLAQVHYEIAREIEPAFANVYFNLAMVLAINNDLTAALDSLKSYQRLVPDKARDAEELLHNLQMSLAAMKQPRIGSK